TRHLARRHAALAGPGHRWHAEKEPTALVRQRRGTPRAVSIHTRLARAKPARSVAAGRQLWGAGCRARGPRGLVPFATRGCRRSGAVRDARFAIAHARAPSLEARKEAAEDALG